VPPLKLSEIGTTSPSLAEMMRACFLRAGLSRTNANSTLVLGNPKAWLGNAYHEVLAKILRADLARESFDAAFNALWDEAVRRQEIRAKGHPLDQRFGVPASWAGYYVVRASAELRARELRPVASPASASAVKGAGLAPSRQVDIQEHKFSTFDGKLRGTPDVIRGREVIDYKSGAILEQDEVTQTEVVKAGYIRQLRIYGFLVHENLGWWPTKGTLLPLGGAGVEVQLDPVTCTQEATEAVTLLARYNDKVKTSASLQDMASPSVEACRWCQYKLLCQPFWDAASAAWSRQLDGGAIDGMLADAPAVIHAGAARAIAVDVQAGSEARQRVHIAPLNPAAHPQVATLAAGERVRIVGLRARADGVLVPGTRTVLFRHADLPSVTT
jgi:hypothetical protein